MKTQPPSLDKASVSDKVLASGAPKTISGAAIKETDRLIASDKVEGTAVYNHQNEHLGAVHNFMVDKTTGRVAYAVMSFGGFLGMGHSYHPLPWRVLNYSTEKGGFVVDLSRERLEKAPTYKEEELPNWSDRAYGDRIDEYYGMPPYWGLI
jgi:hypothetical protein